MASSSSPTAYLRQGLPFPVAFSGATKNHSSARRIAFSVSSDLSRRLSLFHLGTAISQSHLLSSKASILSSAEKNVMEVGTFGNIAQTSPVISKENAIEWAKTDKRRLLHVVYRVGDLDKTIKFYTECLGMKVLRRRDIPAERYSNAFLGYGSEESNFAIELTYSYGVDKYEIGPGFGHFGIEVEDVAKTVELVKSKGGKVTREPGPAEGGSSIIANIEDPDGYTFELFEGRPTLCQVMLRVGDIDRSINFYKKAYGMELLRKKDYPEDKYTTAIMGYGPEDKNAVLELTYSYGVKEYDKGNGYGQYTTAIMGYGPEDKNAVLELTYNSVALFGLTKIATGTEDVYKTAEVVRLCGGKIVLDPGPLPGINTKITACLDPDGWKTVFVDNVDFLKELE